MRKKIFAILNKIYGVMMTVSFFGGCLPLIPFIVALCIGGETGENIAVFLKDQYYPWVIVIGCVAILIGLIAMYIGKLEGLSVKKVSVDSKSTDESETDEKK
jgi:hypothetical protein